VSDHRDEDEDEDEDVDRGEGVSGRGVDDDWVTSAQQEVARFLEVKTPKGSPERDVSMGRSVEGTLGAEEEGEEEMLAGAGPGAVMGVISGDGALWLGAGDPQGAGGMDGGLGVGMDVGVGGGMAMRHLVRAGELGH